MRIISMLFLFLFCINATAQSYVKSFSKENTGTYFVHADESLPSMTNTGVLLEVSNPFERLTTSGARLGKPFIFGAYYTDEGAYVVFNGVLDPWVNYAAVNVFQVYRNSNGSNVTEQVGNATLMVDPFNEGRTDLVRFSGTVLGQSLTGLLIRGSDAPIANCLDFSTGQQASCFNSANIPPRTIPTQRNPINLTCEVNSDHIVVRFNPIPSLYKIDISTSLLNSNGASLTNSFSELYTPARGTTRPGFRSNVSLAAGQRVRYTIRTYGKHWTGTDTQITCSR